jgi:Major tropism determinant N-terminal domain
MSLQIRRGTAAQLSSITPVVGEMIFTTDTKAVYVGDGTTQGGVPVAVGGSGNVTGTNVLTTGIVSATGNVTGGNIRTVGQVSASGNVSANYFIGNGSQLIGITASAVDAANLTGNTLAANVVYSSLTRVGTLANVSVFGNVTGGNLITAGQVVATANVVGGNLTTAGQVVATATITGGNLATGGTASATGNITGGNIVTAGLVTATGNVSGNYLRATLDINAGGNISATNHTGTAVSVTGNVTGGNILTAGNISGSYISGNGSQLTGVLATGIGTLTSLSVTGTATVGNLATGGTVSATGNITGGNVTLSDLGSIHIGNLVITDATIESTEHQLTLGSAGNVGNIIIAGNLQVLGNTTTINSNTVSTNDLTFNLANNAINSSAANGGGIEVGPVGTPFITWLYNNIANTWTTAGGISATGNVTAGNLSVGTGVVSVGSIINNNSNAVGNIGSSTGYFNTVFAKATSAQYADLAENYTADAKYAPGTVVIFGGEQEITISTEVADERVAGAISTNPAHLMNAAQPGLAVALRGRIPVNVIGPVTKGDSLVTSSTAGYAQSVGRSRLYGQAVFAKALETNLEDGEKTIIAVIL